MLSWNITSVFKDQHAMKFKLPVSLPDNKCLILKGNLYFTAQNFWLEFKAGNVAYTNAKREHLTPSPKDRKKERPLAKPQEAFPLD